MYFEKNEYADDILEIIKASSNLPFMESIVNYNGINYISGLKNK